MVKRIGLGVGFWAVMFLAVSVLMVSGLPEIWQKILEIIVSGVAAYILARIYFKKSPGGIKDGVALAIIWLVVGGILDLLVTIQYVKGNGTYLEGLKAFYGMWNLWVGIALMFVGAIVAAKTTRGGELIPKPPSQPPTV